MRARQGKWSSAASWAVSGYGLIFLMVLGWGSACTKPDQFVQKIETETMVADVKDTTTKQLAVTSSQDQMLVSATLSPQVITYFSIKDVTINDKTLKDYCKNDSVSFSAINCAIKKGDVVKVVVMFAPKKLPAPGEDTFRRQVLKVLFHGDQLAILSFHLRGISKGVCDDCAPTPTGTKHVFSVKSITIYVSTPTKPETQTQEIPISNDLKFSLYFPDDYGASGTEDQPAKVYLEGDDIPRFSIPVPGSTLQVPVQGVSGEVSEGDFKSSGDDLYNFSVYGALIKIMDDSRVLPTDLTTRTSFEIPKDYKAEAEENKYFGQKYYQDINFDEILQTFSSEASDALASAYNKKTGELTLVGGVAAPNDKSLYSELAQGTVGFKFVLKEQE